MKLINKAQGIKFIKDSMFYWMFECYERERKRGKENQSFINEENSVQLLNTAIWAHEWKSQGLFTSCQFLHEFVRYFFFHIFSALMSCSTQLMGQATNSGQRHNRLNLFPSNAKFNYLLLYIVHIDISMCNPLFFIKEHLN